MIAALFDCDGTLYTGRFGVGVMTHAAQNGRRAQARLVYASLIPATLLYKLKLLGGTGYDQAIMNGVASLLKGYDEAQIRTIFEWLATQYLLPTRRLDIMAKLPKHKRQGHKVILVSGSFQGAVDIFCRELGADAGIGTGLALSGGVATGRIVPPLVKDEHKARLTRELCAARGWDIDWAASFAFADSISDRHMLEMVGHPTVVYPDAKLHALAQANGWEIIGTPR